jgi:hypothetical protein
VEEAMDSLIVLTKNGPWYATISHYYCCEHKFMEAELSPSPTIA